MHVPSASAASVSIADRAALGVRWRACLSSSVGVQAVRPQWLDDVILWAGASASFASMRSAVQRRVPPVLRLRTMPPPIAKDEDGVFFAPAPTKKVVDFSPDGGATDAFVLHGWLQRSRPRGRAPGGGVSRGSSRWIGNTAPESGSPKDAAPSPGFRCREARRR